MRLFASKLLLTLAQWWWTSIVPSITWPTALTPEWSVKITVHPDGETQTLGHCQSCLTDSIVQTSFLKLVYKFRVKFSRSLKPNFMLLIYSTERI